MKIDEDAIVDQINLDSADVITSVEDLEKLEGKVDKKKRGRPSKKDAQKPAVENVKEKPVNEVKEMDMSNPGWGDYVMSHFEPNEMDDKGNPTVAGLRRVSRLLLGPVLESSAKIISPAQMNKDVKGPLSIVTVEYTLKILWCKLERGLESAYPVVLTDVADVYYGNTDPIYARFPSGVASTRAEGRCYKKALQINKAVAEELTTVPLEDFSPEQPIQDNQITMMKIVSDRIGIDLSKFINAGTRKYNSINDVPFGKAAEMIEVLSKCQNDSSIIKPEWKKENK